MLEVMLEEWLSSFIKDLISVMLGEVCQRTKDMSNRHGLFEVYNARPSIVVYFPANQTCRNLPKMTRE